MFFYKDWITWLHAQWSPSLKTYQPKNPKPPIPSYKISSHWTDPITTSYWGDSGSWVNERALSGLGRLVPTSLNGWNGCLRCTGGCNLPLRPEFQHPGAVSRELKLYDPWKKDKVYICSLRTNIGAVIQTLQFVLATSLSNPIGRWLHWGKHPVS